MRIVEVDLPTAERGYPVYICRGSLRELGRIAADHGFPRRLAVITDETVAGLYGHVALESLEGAGFAAELLVIPPGEGSKNLDTVRALYDALIRKDFDRGCGVCALGGGVVGDIAGLVAATYLRGLPWIQVPTTLLAQVDSSVGGKTGVNHPAGKNLIGAFHQPRFVLIDPQVLGTLPKRELWAGLAEVVKAGLIGSWELFSLLEENWTASLEGDLELLEAAIEGACRVKAEVVSRDEREAGLRRILNFGHTLGHALEAATGYTYFLHGEAVAWGMLGAAWLSRRRDLLGEEEGKRVESLLLSLPKPPLPGIPREKFREHLRRDKKIVAGVLHYVLLRGIGAATVEAGISEEELLSALDYIESLEARS